MAEAKKPNPFVRFGRWISRYFKDLKGECKKITWPTRQETTQMTFVIIVMCAILAGFFSVVDILSGVIVRFILGIGA